MIRKLISIVLLLVVGLLVYNYFFGSAEEKENSKEIFEQIVELGQSAWDLLKSEKKKFEDGKYDSALDGMQNLFHSLREKAEEIGDSEAIQKLNELESQSETLKEDLDAEGEPSPALKRDWERLLNETEQLMNKLEKENR